tara:strand:+ start:843 stop:1475 length:633 start_codon:yes stop_codon:yes gene_type:complete
MAYLQLKKSTHIDAPFNFQLRANPIEIQGKMNQFDKLEYEIPVTNIGSSYSVEKWGDGDPMTFAQGSNLDFKCSGALYGKLVDFSKGELVSVTMASTEKGIKWIVEMSSKEWDKPVDDGGALAQPYGYNSVKNRDDDRSLEIKWGMAFNNSTRLITHIEGENNINRRVEMIQEIMPKMFEIACGMKPLTEVNVPKEITKKEINNDDDVPF